MRCKHCGTENPGIHRFCGMCGKALEDDSAPEESLSPSSTVEEPQSPEPSRSPQPDAPTPAPAYTGGLFNLGAPNDAPSRNLDYLLEDDEPRSRKGLILIGLVAVVLAVGLGWVRFQHGGLPGLGKPSAPTSPTSTPAPEAPPTPSSATTPADSTASTPNSGSQPGNSAPGASPTGTAPATATGSASVTNGQAPSSSTTTPPAADAGPTSPAATVPPSNPPAPDSGDATPGTGKVAAPQSSQPSNPSPSTPPDAVPEPPATPPVKASVPAVEKPARPAKPTPAKGPPQDSVALGEKYLYGRGVPQNCDKGLSYVKPAAEKSNNKAMITMGALYATGHCLSRDLPTAYRYFALALRQDPENGALKQNAEMVWGQMTQSERQLAIRMTQ